MQRRNNIYNILHTTGKAILCLLVLLLFLPATPALYNEAEAAVSPVIPTTAPTRISANKKICPSTAFTNPNVGFTSRLIPCIRDSVIYATDQLVKPLAIFFADIVRNLAVLALIFLGMKVVSGDTRSLSRDTLVLGMKIGVIIFFTENFGNWYATLLESLESLINLIISPVVSGTMIWRDTTTGSPSLCTIGNFSTRPEQQNIMTIWNILDCYLDLFIGGIFSPVTLVGSIVGFIIGSMFSTYAGVFIGMIGFYILFSLMFIIARTVYIFITAYVAFSFMAIVSSVFVPCLFFQYTKRYFDNWLAITVNFLFQPVFVMCYLVLFLVAFNYTVFQGKHSLYYTIAGEASDISKNPSFNLGNWLSANGIYKETGKAKHNIVADSTKLYKELYNQGTNQTMLVKQQTAVQDDQGAFNKANPTLDVGNTNAGSAGIASLSHFETAIMFKIVDWETLARAEDNSKGTAKIFPTLTTQAQKDDFYKQYKIRVLLAFLMAAVFMYLLYSLIGYIPYIGNAAMGARGIPVGTGMLSMPGSRLFGGGHM